MFIWQLSHIANPCKLFASKIHEKPCKTPYKPEARPEPKPEPAREEKKQKKHHRHHNSNNEWKQQRSQFILSCRNIIISFRENTVDKDKKGFLYLLKGMDAAPEINCGIFEFKTYCLVTYGMERKNYRKYQISIMKEALARVESIL